MRLKPDYRSTQHRQDKGLICVDDKFDPIKKSGLPIYRFVFIHDGPLLLAKTLYVSFFLVKETPSRSNPPDKIDTSLFVSSSVALDKNPNIYKQ